MPAMLSYDCRVCRFSPSSPLPSSAMRQASTYPDPTQRVLTHREQNALVTPWIKKRFDTLLGPLMTREGIDMWIIPTREYNEDPVFRVDVAAHLLPSRRRTILVFYNPGGGKPVERYSIGRFDYDGLFTMVPTPNDGQHEGLRKLVDEKNPKVIGINESDAWNHADGITANEKRRLVEALGPAHAAEIKSAEMLAVGWLEMKLPEELDAYRHAMKVAHMVIREAFSNKVITPGKTTNEDVVWWMRQRVVEMGLGKWFHPSVTIWRQGEKTNPRGVDSARRHAPHRLRHRLSRLLDRHAAQRLRAEARRDRRARGTEGRTQGRQSPAGSDDAVRDGWSGRATRRWPMRWRRRRRKGSCRRSTAIRSAITATRPDRRSA